MLGYVKFGCLVFARLTATQQNLDFSGLEMEGMPK